MDIVLLTQDQCAFCEQAKDMLEHLARDYPLAVRIVDIVSHEGQKLAEGGGVLFAPGIFLDGEPFSYGRPSERKLRRELDWRLHGGKTT